jgi:hypothetical protein
VPAQDGKEWQEPRRKAGRKDLRERAGWSLIFENAAEKKPMEKKPMTGKIHD